MTPLEAVALVLAYVAQADGVLAPEERQAICDVVPELVPATTPRDITTIVVPLLAGGKQKLKVGMACLALASQPAELRLATLRSAMIVARSHERTSDDERARLVQLGKDLEVPEDEVARLFAGPPKV